MINPRRENPAHKLNNMETYIISGGGQYVRQCEAYGIPVSYSVEDTDYQVKSGFCGCSDYTLIWATSYEDMVRYAKEWQRTNKALYFKRTE